MEWVEGRAAPLFHFRMRNPFYKQTGQAARREPGATWGLSPIYGGEGHLSSSGGDRQEFGGVATEREVEVGVVDRGSDLRQ